MRVELYINNSEVEKVVKNLTTLQSLEGTLREATSILNPTIKIEGLTDIDKINYMYIPDFGRYYFVNDIRSIRNNLYEVSAHVDVLMTYAEQIKQQKAVIRRQENVWNTYLDDGTFKAYQNPVIVTKLFPNGFNNNSFVLALSGTT